MLFEAHGILPSQTNKENPVEIIAMLHSLGNMNKDTGNVNNTDEKCLDGNSFGNNIVG